MKQVPLIPRPPKRMRQPRKDWLRDELARIGEENAALRAENARLRSPWWRRLFGRSA